MNAVDLILRRILLPVPFLFILFDDFGLCCSSPQLPLSRGSRAGLCPADPDYTDATGNQIFGKCSAVYPDSDKDLGGTTIPCFQGQVLMYISKGGRISSSSCSSSIVVVM